MKKIYYLIIVFCLATFSKQVSYGQMLIENFDYNVGSLLTANGWTAHSGAGTNSIAVSTSSITYTGYIGSGIGNKTSMTTTGEDVNRAFASKNSGNLYAAFLVNVTSAQTTGDYFAHFATTSGSSVTVFAARVWIKKDASSSNFAFGVSKSSSNVSYTGFNYTPGTTYLVVVKHKFISGTSNDLTELFINPVIAPVEPTPTVSSLTADNATTDPSQLVSFCLRQGNASNASAQKIDGIRVDSTWAGVIGATNIAPSWTNGWPKIENVLPTSFDTKVNIDIPGTSYYVVLPNNATAPTAIQVKSGFDATNNPVPANMKGTVVCTLGNTEYSSTVSGLSPNTSYNTFFIAESNNILQANPVMVLATTPSSSVPPSISSLNATSITHNSALLGGNITSDGGSPILNRGTVWNTSPNVSINDNYLSEGGTSTGTFSHTRSSLPSKAQIFYKSFATNAIGTTLSTETSFFTLAEKPVSHVTNFTATANSATEIGLSWTPTFGTDGYIIIHRVGALAPTGMPIDATGYTVGSVLGNGVVSAILTSGSANNTTISGLSPMTQYTFIIIPFGYDGANYQTFSYNTNPIIPQSNATTLTPPAVEYTWNTNIKGSWTDANNWTPARNYPANNDILKFNNGGVDTITSVPTQTIGQIIVENNTQVFLQAGGTNTVSLSGYTGIDLSVGNGSMLNIIGTNALTLKLLTNATGSIYGSMNFGGGAHKLEAIDALSIEFNNGSSLTQDIGCTGNIFNSTGTANIVTFKNGSSFIQKAGSNPFALNAPNSKVVFEPNSTFKLNSNLTPSFSGRTYGNFELDFVGANLNVSGTGAIVINNLIITNGTLNFNMTANPGHSIKGNITVAGGGFLNFAPTSAAVINLNGTTQQTINAANPIKINRFDTIFVNNPDGLVINDSIVINGTLNINEGKISLNYSISIDTLGIIITNSINEYIVLNNNSKLFKRFPVTGGTFIYPIGESLPYSKYLPVSLNFNSGTFSPNNYVGIKTIALKHPNDLSTGNYLKRYWSLESSGIINFSADINFQYDINDVEGSEGLIYCKNFSTNPIVMYDLADINNHQLNATGVTLLGEFGGGENLTNKTLILNVILEGLFNGTNMNPVQDDMGDHIGPNAADYINVELRNSVNPSIVEASFTNQILGTNGVCQVNIPASLSDAYYIVIKHRNSIATWSANPVSFTNQIISYNFSDSDSKAYGDNLKQVTPGIYAIFVGDVNQDEVIDIFDLVDMDYDLTNGTVDYISYDINGDGVVDVFDLLSIDENLTNGIVSIYP